MPFTPIPPPPSASPSLEEARPALRALVQARVETRATRAADFKGQLGTIAAKMQARRDAGLRAPNDPFLLALDGADRIGLGALAKKHPPAGQSDHAVSQPGGTAGGNSAGGAPYIPKAVRPGVKTKEESRYAYASGQNYMDRQVPPERERGE